MVNYIDTFILLIKTVGHVTERSKFRKCPNPTVIQRFLHENTPFTGDIRAEDIVCIACYKAHLVNSSDAVQSLDKNLAET
jgi:hypothetical protein